MNSQIPRTARALVLGLLPIAAVACGGADKQVIAPNVSTTPDVSRFSTRDSLQSVPTVHVSDDIMVACGIPSTDAYFSFDSAKIRRDDDGTLAKVSKCFTSGPMKGQNMRLIGHADPRGASDYNMALGQSRADSVANYLESVGMDRAKTLPTSRGSLDATGNDEASWARDRRVDLTVAK